MKKLFLPLSVLLTIYSCNQKPESSKPDVVVQNMDSTVSPSDDFFMYLLNPPALQTFHFHNPQMLEQFLLLYSLQKGHEEQWVH